jgi:tetratricopeptide (TPR) repeat protein
VVALDPMSVRMNLYLGIHSFFGFEMELASSAFQKVLSVVPDHRCALEFVGWMAALDGNYEKALQYFEQLQPVSGFRLHQSTCLGWVYYKMGNKEKAHQYLEKMEKLEKESEWNTFYTIDLATLYTCFEDFDKAFIYLEKAISNRIGDMMMLDSFDVYFGALRHDPRFKNMLDLIGDVPSIDI